jgi:hypothetical protein
LNKKKFRGVTFEGGRVGSKTCSKSRVSPGQITPHYN